MVHTRIARHSRVRLDPGPLLRQRIQRDLWQHLARLQVELEREARLDRGLGVGSRVRLGRVEGGGEAGGGD